MERRIYSIRGAVCSENTADSITENVCNMCNDIFTKNSIKAEDLVSIQFTMTPDLDVLNPATALRRGNVVIDTTKTALFCSQEAVIVNMLPKVIRVMVTAYLPEGSEINTVYLNGAQKLRPDWHKE